MNESSSSNILKRPRRNRQSSAIRSLTRESILIPSDLIVPLFVIEGKNKKEPIPSMPDIYRLSIDLLLKSAEKLHKQGIQAIALYPVIKKDKKNDRASESYNSNSLVSRAIKALKTALPSLCVIADIALDPFTSHGHDGLVNEFHEIDNDLTLDILVRQALCYSSAGVDIVAPSEMMDGRIKRIREHLDSSGFKNTAICSYTAKYASSFYGPFRQALNTSLSFGDKKTYQLDPSNHNEAIREAQLDEEEGADMLLVKPGLPYLDVLYSIKKQTTLPIGAYHVSGEYSMVMAAHQQGYIDCQQTFLESLICFKRAGADFIFTYAANHILPLLNIQAM